jgi:hypothetical protein
LLCADQLMGRAETMATRRFSRATPYGHAGAQLSYSCSNEGVDVLWQSGTIQICTVGTSLPLPGFETPQAVQVSSDGKKLLWRPAYGTDAGQLRPISVDTEYDVLLDGIDTSGVPYVIARIRWRVEKR